MSFRKLVGNMLRRVGYQAVRTDMLVHLGLCLHLRKLFESQRIDTVWDVGANRGQFYRLLRKGIGFKGLHLRKLFESQRIDTVWDVGANRGEFYRLLRKGIGFKGTILSFEPISELHKLLAEKSKNDPKWHVFPFALGEKQEQLSINIMKANDMSSFLTPDQGHTDRFRDSNTPIKTELVNIKCLDDIFEKLRESYRIERSYLKMDTQGYDLNVVKGGRKVISNFVGLQTEASILPVYKEMPDYRKAIHFMNEIGFELSGLFPVARDEKWRLIEFDCVMVNPEKIDFIPTEMH